MVTEPKVALFLQKNFHEFFNFGHFKNVQFSFYRERIPQKKRSPDFRA